MDKINVHEAKTRLSQLLERAHAGEEIIIAKGGKPYARLCPLESLAPRMPGLLTGEVGDEFFEPLPEDELDAWEMTPERSSKRPTAARKTRKHSRTR
jgi:prevent-host-death family protein